MPRLQEYERRAMMNAHEAHWEEANDVAGSPILLLATFHDGVPAAPYGLPEFRAQKAEYEALSATIERMANMDLPLLRAERDAIIGTDDPNSDAVWPRLALYRPMVKANLGSQHSLNATVPTLGVALSKRYGPVLDAFVDHWTRVNEALGEHPLTIGDFTLADLQTARDAVLAKMEAIATIEEGDLPLRREEREQLFGNMPESRRLDTSIIARLMVYHLTIRARFAGQPLARTLPRIFPRRNNVSAPTFAYNFTLSGAVLRLWFMIPDVEDGTSVVLQAGETQQTQSINLSAAGEVMVTDWNDIKGVQDVDRVAIRNDRGRTVARGVRDADLVVPV